MSQYRFVTAFFIYYQINITMNNKMLEHLKTTQIIYKQTLMSFNYFVTKCNIYENVFDNSTEARTV